MFVKHINNRVFVQFLKNNRRNITLLFSVFLSQGEHHMQDISKLLIQIMETLHCDAMKALVILEGDKDVSDALFLCKPLSEQSDNESGSESSR